MGAWLKPSPKRVVPNYPVLLEKQSQLYARRGKQFTTKVRFSHIVESSEPAQRKDLSTENGEAWREPLPLPVPCSPVREGVHSLMRSEGSLCCRGRAIVILDQCISSPVLKVWPQVQEICSSEQALNALQEMQEWSPRERRTEAAKLRES